MKVREAADVPGVGRLLTREPAGPLDDPAGFFHFSPARKRPVPPAATTRPADSIIKVPASMTESADLMTKLATAIIKSANVTIKVAPATIQFADSIIKAAAATAKSADSITKVAAPTTRAAPITHPAGRATPALPS